MGDARLSIGKNYPIQSVENREQIIDVINKVMKDEFALDETDKNSLLAELRFKLK